MLVKPSSDVKICMQTLVMTVMTRGRHGDAASSSNSDGWWSSRNHMSYIYDSDLLTVIIVS